MFTTLFSWIVGLSWFLMYNLGLGASLLTCLAYFNFMGGSYPRIKSLFLSLAWFITFPIFAGYLLWAKKDQIRTLGEQLKALRQMQEQLAAINQLSLAAESEGETFDKGYEQQ
jgi:hypothetical protein